MPNDGHALRLRRLHDDDFEHFDNDHRGSDDYYHYNDDNFHDFDYFNHQHNLDHFHDIHEHNDHRDVIFALFHLARRSA